MHMERDEWEIGLPSWIIQDGNYGDFKVGEQVEFALEFYPHSIRSNKAMSRSAKRLGPAKYEINGDVIYLKDEVWLLDFGICAFQESTPPDELRVGQFVTREIYLGIDPFFYFERLYTLPGMPPLVCSWKINSIGQQTAQFIETHEPSGHKVLVRDEKKLGYKTIEATDAWNDDGGNGEYVLKCVRFDVPPKFGSATAT